MILLSLKLMDLPECEFKTGEVILEEGKPGSKVYVLIEGEVAISIGDEQVRTINAEGAVFGEISALLGRNHTATVSTTVESKFFVIDDLMTFLRQNPEHSIALLKILSERVVAMNSRLTEPSSKGSKSWWRAWWS